jgi:hypothetical protein
MGRSLRDALSDRRQPQDHVAVPLPRPAHGPQTSDDGMVEPDQALTPLVMPFHVLS